MLGQGGMSALLWCYGTVGFWTWHLLHILGLAQIWLFIAFLAFLSSCSRLLKIPFASLWSHWLPFLFRVGTVQIEWEILVVEGQGNETKEIAEVFICEYSVVNSLEAAIILNSLNKFLISGCVLILSDHRLYLDLSLFFYVKSVE